MASINGTGTGTGTGMAAQTLNSPATSQPRPEGNRSGRGRGRGGLSEAGRSRVVVGGQDLPEGQTRRHEGRGGRRGRGAPRGMNSSHQKPNSNTLSASDLPARFAVATSPNGQIISTAPQTAIDGSGALGEEDAEEAEVCFICASPVVHTSVAPCNHRTCHICALRMRALYKTKDCAHCRTEAQYVIFTDDSSKRFEDFTTAELVSTDENIGIKYEKQEIVEDTVLLLRYNCPDPSCDVACLGWPDLHRHVRSVHHKKMCDLCTRNKKVFTHEHELFLDKELERHMKKGDDNPGAIDQSGFKGHPLCGFCGERFYGDDELYVHCRAKHERCFICDRREGRQPQYYMNYDSLWAHFRKDHFPCQERECLEKKFVVFPSELDLKAHQLEEHGNTLSKDVRRDARVVDISSFDYRAPYIEERRGGGSQREGRGRGRGRDPNADPIPASSAQPLRRDEQAFQRQMAIQSAQSGSARNSGGQATQGGRTGLREPPSMTIPRPSSNVDHVVSQISSIEMQNSNPDVSPQEQARRLRHSAVLERASAFLQHEQIKVARFRNAISSFRTGAITAAALIDTFFALFSDTSASSLGSLVREVADLYEDLVKAESLRTAWNDWRAINENYPSLPGPSGMTGNPLPLGWAQVTSSTPSASPAPPKSTARVLKLKSSTAQSSRSSASRNASWGSASGSSTSSFPGLPAAPAPTPRATQPLRTNTLPWLTANVSSNPGSARPTPPTSRPASRGPQPPRVGASSDAFPALPPAAKPTTTLFGYGTGAVRRDVGAGSGGFTWGGAAVAGETAGGAGEGEGSGNVSGGGGGKKNGNKGKKMLLHWG